MITYNNFLQKYLIDIIKWKWKEYRMVQHCHICSIFLLFGLLFCQINITSGLILKIYILVLIFIIKIFRFLNIIFCIFIIFEEKYHKFIGLFIKPVFCFEIQSQWDNRRQKTKNWVISAQRNMNKYKKDNGRSGLHLSHDLHILVGLVFPKMFAIFYQENVENVC